MKTKILYLSYNGMNEALGASQVLSYLYQLSDEYEYHLISLEKPKDFADKQKMNVLQNTIQSKDIFWHPVEYKTDKMGKLFNFFRLLNASKKIVRHNDIKFAHTRSYFPAMIAYILGLKYLFDTRGFAFDERADVGAIKRNGFIFKFLKKIEKKLYKKASGINKLSYEGKRTIEENELFEGGNQIKNITVIPTCVDLERFNWTKRRYQEKVRVGYVGTATGWYNFDKTLIALKAIGKKIDYDFTIFNDNQHSFISEKLLEHQIPLEKVTLKKIPFSEMPERLTDFEIALFYIHPYFSKRASAATKIGELLASGIPVLTNGNVGDHEFYIEQSGCGKILDFEQLDSYDFENLLNKLRTEEVSRNCRKLAQEYFSLEKGVEKYRELYKLIFA